MLSPAQVELTTVITGGTWGADIWIYKHTLINDYYHKFTNLPAMITEEWEKREPRPASSSSRRNCVWLQCVCVSSEPASYTVIHFTNLLSCMSKTNYTVSSVYIHQYAYRRIVPSVVAKKWTYDILFTRSFQTGVFESDQSEVINDEEGGHPLCVHLD